MISYYMLSLIDYFVAEGSIENTSGYSQAGNKVVDHSTDKGLEL